MKPRRSRTPARGRAGRSRNYPAVTVSPSVALPSKTGCRICGRFLTFSAPVAGWRQRLRHVCEEPLCGGPKPLRPVAPIGAALPQSRPSALLLQAGLPPRQQAGQPAALVGRPGTTKNSGTWNTTLRLFAFGEILPVRNPAHYNAF